MIRTLAIFVTVEPTSRSFSTTSPVAAELHAAAKVSFGSGKPVLLFVSPRVGTLVATLESVVTRFTNSYAPPPCVMGSERPRVLLVDDDPLLLRTTRRGLEACLHVLISPEPVHALSILCHEPVDVLVTDHEIPGTPGGVWLLEQVQERFPEVKRILTSGHTVPAAVLANEAVQSFVPKSAGLGQLTAQIAECLAE